MRPGLLAWAGRIRRPSPGTKWFLLGAMAASFAGCWYWRIWDNGLRAPIAYAGDALIGQSIAKTIATRGWYLSNPLLGAPGGQTLYDFPLGSDNLNFAGLRILAVFTKNPIILVNVFYYLTFPLIFASAYYALRRLRFSPSVAATFGVVYAVAPFHFSRNITHVLLSAYYSVPLACLLLYDILIRSGEERVPPAEDQDPNRKPRDRRPFRGKILARWVWIPIILGSAGAYWALFFLILAAGLGVLLAGYHRDLRRLALPAFLVGVTIIVLFVNNLPTFVYQFAHGRNQVVAQRVFGEADSLALQWAYLLLPIDGHRVAPLAALSWKAHASVSPLQGYGLAIGAIAAIGLVVSLAALIAGSKPQTHAGAMLRRSGVLNVCAILLGSVGGGSLLLGLAGFQQLHEYGRLVVFVGFFSLVAVATAAEPVRAALKRRFRPNSRLAGTAGLAILVAVTMAAALDQTTSNDLGKRRNEASLREDRNLAKSIEKRVGPDAMILEAPLLGFPEEAVIFPSRKKESNLMVEGLAIFTGLEMLRPFLHTSAVRWSYGRVQARPGDVVAALRAKPMDLFLTEAVAAGFAGLYVDRDGFPDGARQMRAELKKRVGDPALSSETGRMLFYDFRDYARRWRESTPLAEVRAVETRVARPLFVTWGSGFSTPYGPGLYFPQLEGFTYVRNARKVSVLSVMNPAPSPRRITIHFTARLLSAGAGNLRVSGDGVDLRSKITDGGTPLTVTAEIKPGTTRFRFSTDGPEVSVFRPLGHAALGVENAWFEG